MYKISIVLIITAAATIVSTANGDLLGDMFKLEQSFDLKGLDVLKILLNPNQSFELKIAEIILSRTLNRLAENGEGVSLKLDQATSMDIGQVFTVDADLTDSQNKVQKCKVTIWIHFITNVTDLTFDCKGMPTIVKHVKWDSME